MKILHLHIGKKDCKRILRLMIYKLLLRFPFLFNFVKMIEPSFKKYKLKSLYDYVTEKHYELKMLDSRTIRQYKLPPNNRVTYEKWEYKEEIDRKCSRQYTVVLKDAVVRGQTDGIFLDNYYLTDRIEYDKKGLKVLWAPYMGSDGNNCIIRDVGHKKEISAAVTLLKEGSSNYFHFVYESLLRISSLEMCSEYQNYPLLVDAIVKEDLRNIELINLLNEKKREIIWVSINESILVHKLLVPPVMCWGIWNIKYAMKKGYGYMIDSRAGQYLRNKVLSQYAIPKKRYNCVYVARGNNQRLLNEENIINFFSEKGFDIFYPDKGSFLDEVDCFSTANCIVLCAGGASTNLIFCKKTVDIYCILPIKYRSDSPEDITVMLGITPHLRDANIKRKGSILMNSTFEFPISKCEEIVLECKHKNYL